MITQAIRVLPIPLQTVAFGSITGSYTAIGAAMTAPIRISKIQNSTDQDVIISWDGINDHDAVVAGSGMVLDITTNKSLPQGAFIGIGTIFYVKYASAPSEGNIYLSAFYAVAN